MMIGETQTLQLQNRLLNDEVKRRNDQLAAVSSVAANIGQSLHLDKTLEAALRAVLEVTGAQAGGISLIDEQAGEVVLRAQQGWLGDFVNENPMRIPLGKGMSGRVINEDTVIVHNNLADTEPLAVPRFHDEKFRSIAMAPMHARGNVIGILSIMSSVPNSFDDDHIDVLRSVADTIGVALDNARLYERSLEDQRRLSAILHSTADGIIATDQHGLIRLINHATEVLLEVHAEDLLGIPLRSAPLPMTVTRSMIFAIENRAEDRANSFSVSLENGRVISVTLSPVMVESQVMQTALTDGWVMVLQDVTHLREMEMARSQFIKAAAHDMRNPLGAALNSVSMLRRLLRTNDDTILEVMDIAHQGITRIQGLIDDLLSLEQIQSSYEFNPVEVDIGELIYEVSAAAQMRLEHRALQLRVVLEGKVAPILLDRRWVTRAINNYLDNAVKYTPFGGEITLRVFPRDAHLHIEVIDNGEGIPLEVQPRLFERFYRANAMHGVAGAGLGLAMVKSIAEAHGGEVYVQSMPGQGSVFGMTLSMGL